MTGAAAVHAVMGVPKAVHRDEAAEAEQLAAHAAYMDEAFEHARVLLAGLAAARRRAAAAWN